MPQMAPMSWLMLYVYFFIIFMLFCMMVYYTYLPVFNLKTSSISKLSFKSLNWKW